MKIKACLTFGEKYVSVKSKLCERTRQTNKKELQKVLKQYI